MIDRIIQFPLHAAPPRSARTSSDRVHLPAERAIHGLSQANCKRDLYAWSSAPCLAAEHSAITYAEWMQDMRQTDRPGMTMIAAVQYRLGQLPGLAARGLIKLYRYILSPLIGFRCRHLPTCSDYADEAVARYGLWAGGWMTLARVLRCQPFGTSGLDFVPGSLPAGARWYMPWRYARWRGVNDAMEAGPDPAHPAI
jgi:putative membrane protein insertion efficiency factor